MKTFIFTIIFASLFSYASIGYSASIDEIKKSYRSLVKQHHPDVFANASEAQQKMAEEKFLKIQEAYEGMLDK